MPEKQSAPAAKAEATPAGQVDVTYTGDKRFESGGVQIGKRIFVVDQPVRMSAADAAAFRESLDQYSNYKFTFADVAADAKQQQEG